MNLESLVNDYKAKTSRSRQMYEEALRVMPGGNSRTTTFFDPYPFYITRGPAPASGTPTAPSASTSTATTRA